MRLRVLRNGCPLVPVCTGFLAGICITLLSNLRNIDITNVSRNTADTRVKRDGDLSDASSVADQLYDDIRVLCWVMTHKDNWYTKAIHVKRTWGLRCSKLLFFSSESSKDSLNVIGLETNEGRLFLDVKTKLAFKYVYEHYVDDFDWFVRADDDTYIIMENLRHFLSDKDPNEAVYFGKLFKTRVKGGSFSAGAGIVLGKEALRRFAVYGGNVERCRPKITFADDLQLGMCLQALGVVVGNTSDVFGRSRFHSLDWRSHITGQFPDWYYEVDSDGAMWGIDSISEYTISFHYVTPEEMYLFELLIYQIRLFGVP